MYDPLAAALSPVTSNPSCRISGTAAKSRRRRPRCARNCARALGIVLLAAAPAITRAQSSVTLYGVLDEGIDFTNNAAGHQAWKLQSGDLQGQRWGVKGSEDLGNGLAAVFTLENGFDINNGTLGQGGRMFGRQAFVGLADARRGTLTWGRQYDSLVDYLAPLTANGDWGGGPFAHPFDNDNTSNSFRLDNALKYTSIAYRGWSFGGAYAFSNQAGGFADNRAYSVGGQYHRGPLTAAAAYVDAQRPGTSAQGALPADNTTFIASRQRIWGAGLRYQFGQALISAVYTQATLSRPVGSVYTGALATVPDALKFLNFELNLQYRFAPALIAGVMYTYTEGRFDAAGNRVKPKWQQTALIVDYSLSTRTDVYAQAGYQRVMGGQTGTTLDRAQVNGAADISSNRSQLLLRLGVRHRF